MYAYELYEQNSPQVVVTYPGRFQPFHQGHAGVFEILQKKFGSENVYILTSNDTSSTKSPFNFSDKYQLMTSAGVSGDRIVETNKMYVLPPNFNPSNTIFITVVGGPDADRLNPDSYIKKDQRDKDGNIIKPAGSPSYYKTWNEKEAPVTADKHGYVVVIPELQKRITIDGETYDVSHGTDARNLWNKIRDDDIARKEFLTKMYKYPHQELGTIFDKIQRPTTEDISSDSNDTASPISGNKINESKNSEFKKLYVMISKFLPIAMKFLKLKSLPKIKIDLMLTLEEQASFGKYSPESNIIKLGIKDRHPVDVLRTLAHELVHYKQHLDGKLKADSGITGSSEENQANQYAGILMRIFNKKFPEGIQGDILVNENYASEDQHPNERPRGPEFKPTMPKGTVRVDVSDVYDWYKLGQHISDMKGLGKHDFGKGPPSTVLSFGDEDTEHKYIADLEKTGLTTTDIDPVDPKQPKGMKRQKVDPTFNVNENYKRRLVKSK